MKKMQKTADGADAAMDVTSGQGPTMQEVAEFFASTPNPDDKQFHAWSDAKGYNTHKAEAMAYQLATVASKFVTGGKTGEKEVTTDDVSTGQMQQGKKVEKEHTPDTGSAKKIAMDHLDEIPDYYSRLKKMEEQAKAQKEGSEDRESDWYWKHFLEKSRALRRGHA